MPENVQMLWACRFAISRLRGSHSVCKWQCTHDICGCSSQSATARNTVWKQQRYKKWAAYFPCMVTTVYGIGYWCEGNNTVIKIMKYMVCEHCAMCFTPQKASWILNFPTIDWMIRYLWISRRYQYIMEMFYDGCNVSLLKIFIQSSQFQISRKRQFFTEENLNR